jgi:hypothetical protein
VRALVALCLVAAFLSGCASDDNQASGDLESLLMVDSDVVAVAPSLAIHPYADGRTFGVLDESELAELGGSQPTEGVARQWSTASRSPTASPGVTSLLSTVLQFSSAASAADAAEAVLRSAGGQDGAVRVQHENFEAFISSDTQGDLYEGVGAVAVGSRLVSVQALFAGSVSQPVMRQLLDIAAARLP